MVGVSMNIDETALHGLNALLVRIATLTPKRIASETRHAAILLCNSLRARTRQAPKKIPKSEYSATPSAVPPRYMFYFGKNDKTRQGMRDKPLRRWTLTRKLGTPDAYAKHYFVYTSAHRNKRGKMVGMNAAEERRELLQQHGGIPRHGLAKKSWGWIAKEIYNAVGIEDLAYRPRKGEQRDPRRAVNGVFQRLKDGGIAVLHNKLDYILDALQPGALDESVRAATSNLYHSVEASLIEAEEKRAASTTRRGGGTPWWVAYAKGRIR